MKIGDITWMDWIDSGDWRGSNDISMPMLPSLVPHVMPLVVDRDISVLKVARVIAKEQVLATRVLRLANSAFSAPMHEVTTINDAIVRMGTSAVRNVVLAVCFASRPANDVYGARGRELADHGVGTAYLARLVAEHAGLDPDEAFMHGLLHDMGKLLLLKLAADFTRFGGSLPPAPEIDAFVAERHAALGADILNRWQLPSRLQAPVRFHHRPEEATEFQEYAEVVYAANQLAHRYGFGCTPELPDGDDDEALASDPVGMRLGMTPAWLAGIDKRAPGLFAVARQIVS
jgi:putative nucleotidyltransferase with HDIG domain